MPSEQQVSDAADLFESLVVDAGIHLCYLRVLATDLDAAGDDNGPADTVAGLLATVPVHVPIAVGSAASGTAAKQQPGTSSGALLARARNRYRTIDTMLEHPRARAEREDRR